MRVPFIAIVLSVLQITDSDYPIGIQTLPINTLCVGLKEFIQQILSILWEQTLRLSTCRLFIHPYETVCTSTLTKDKTNYKSGSLGYSQAFTFWYIDDVFSVINYLLESINIRPKNMR
jgi:hypothetical protein